MANTLEIYKNHLRSFIKDTTVLNRLLNYEEENTDDDLELYLNMALGFLSMMPPNVGSYNYASFPIPALLIHQATIECLISNGIVGARNELTYNNGGVTVKISDGDRYLRLLQQLYRMTDMEIKAYKQIKIALNIEGGYGGVHSPYAWLHGTASSLQPNSILSG